MSPNVDSHILKTLHSGWIGEGPKVKEFEEKLKVRLKKPNFVAVNSCTSAMELALHLIDDGKGGEIITNPIACIASITAIVSRGFRPRFADIEPLTGNLNLRSVFDKINPQTKGVLSVNFCGNQADFTGFLKGTSVLPKNIWYIEDCAQSLRADYNYSDWHIQCYSFQSVKTLTTGDGGGLVVPSDMEQRARSLRWYGLDRQQDRYEQSVKEPGYKFMMNDIAATIGLCNLEQLEGLEARQILNRNFYYNSLPDSVTKLDGKASSCPLYPILVENRDDFQRMMKSKGIEVARPHSLCTRHSFVQEYLDFYSLEHAEEFDRKIVAIPAGWWVTGENSEYVVKSIEEGW